MRPECSKAFARVYDQCVSQVYGYFGYRFDFRETAEIMTRRTFERAKDEWRTFDPREASANAWTMTLARAVARDHQDADAASAGRGRMGRPSAPPGTTGDASAVSAANTETGTEAGTVSEEANDPGHGGQAPGANLRSALALLDELERELVALRFGGGVTVGELAQLTGRGEGEVTALISRALARLGDGRGPVPSEG